MEAANKTLQFWRDNPNFALIDKCDDGLPARSWFSYPDPSDPIIRPESFEIDIPRSKVTFNSTPALGVALPGETGVYEHNLESLASYRKRIMAEFRERLNQRCTELQRKLYWTIPTTWFRDATWTALIRSGKKTANLIASDHDSLNHPVDKVWKAVERFAVDIELNLCLKAPP